MSIYLCHPSRVSLRAQVVINGICNFTVFSVSYGCRRNESLPDTNTSALSTLPFVKMNGSYAGLIPLAKPKAPDDKEKEKQEKEDTTGEGKP